MQLTQLNAKLQQLHWGVKWAILFKYEIDLLLFPIYTCSLNISTKKVWFRCSPDFSNFSQPFVESIMNFPEIHDTALALQKILQHINHDCFSFSVITEAFQYSKRKLFPYSWSNLWKYYSKRNLLLKLFSTRKGNWSIDGSLQNFYCFSFSVITPENFTVCPWPLFWKDHWWKNVFRIWRWKLDQHVGDEWNYGKIREQTAYLAR